MLQYVPLLRNLIRVGGGALLHSWAIAKEDVDAIFNDPAMDLVIGAALLGSVELWYVAAKKFGWST